MVITSYSQLASRPSCWLVVCLSVCLSVSDASLAAFTDGRNSIQQQQH